MLGAALALVTDALLGLPRDTPTRRVRDVCERMKSDASLGTVELVVFGPAAYVIYDYFGGPKFLIYALAYPVLLGTLAGGAGFSSTAPAVRAQSVPSSAATQPPAAPHQMRGQGTAMPDATMMGTHEKMMADMKAMDATLDALVSNAAYGQPGAVEDLSRDALRRQFESNLQRHGIEGVRGCVRSADVQRAFVEHQYQRVRRRRYQRRLGIGRVGTDARGFPCGTPALECRAGDDCHGRRARPVVLGDRAGHFRALARAGTVPDRLRSCRRRRGHRR